MSGGVITVNGAVHISDIYVQGGTDARQWLTKIDWQNFASEVRRRPAQSTPSMMVEDMFVLGMDSRTKGIASYLTCADDLEQTS